MQGIRIAILGVLCFVGIKSAAEVPVPERQAAKFNRLSVAGDCDGYLEADRNFGIVYPGKLYRSAAPPERFLRYLKETYGLTAIVDLRHPEYRKEGKQIQTEKRWSARLGLNHHLASHLPGNAEELVSLVRRLMAEGQVVLVHCHGGKDRTGNVVARLRLQDGWGYEEAVSEMRIYKHKPEGDPEAHKALRALFAAAGLSVSGIRPELRARLANPQRCFLPGPRAGARSSIVRAVSRLAAISGPAW